MATRVHRTAVVEAGAELADGVVIGPFCYVGSTAVIGEDTELVAQVTVLGPCRIGRRNRIHPYATLGGEPQDRGYGGEPTKLVIGDDNVFRESVTAHRGTLRGGGVTRIGSGSLFMVGAHVAHDAVVGDRVTLANGTTLGGHVTVGERFVSGGHVAVAPFVTLGELSFAAGGALIERDVPPFVIVAGDRARVRGLNRVGLERGGVPEASRQVLGRVYREVFRSDLPIAVAAASARERFAEDPFARRLIDFLIDRSRPSGTPRV